MARRAMMISTCLALAVTSLGAGSGSVAGPPTVATTPDPKPAWSALRFTARKLFFESTTEIRLERVVPETLGGVLVEPAEGEAGLRPTGSPVALMTVDSRFASRHDESSLWFELETGRALQRFKIRHGKKAYRKKYRFAAGGVHVRRIAPLEGEVSQPHERWSKIEDRFYRHGEEGCAVVLEPTVLLYLLAEAPPAPGEPLELCTFSGKMLQRVVVENKGSQTVEVDYGTYLPGNDQPARHRGRQDLLRLELRPAGEGDELELLGLEGAIEVYVDPRQRLPVRVEGRLDFFGRVSVVLETAWLTAPPRTRGGL